MALGLLGMAGAIGGGIGGGIARVGGSRLAGAAVGAAGGGLAGYHADNHKTNVKTKQFQKVRNLIKDRTDGLGGLVYSKKKNKFVMTYAGSPKEAAKKGHVMHLQAVIAATKDPRLKLDIDISDRVGFMSDKQSKKLTNTIKDSMKTEEGIEKLQSYFQNSQLERPYESDYGTKNFDRDPFGFGTSMKRFPTVELRERES
tara:strand:- start:418 stop:1017 length:600 start_codon:yes stop_codon:yes gene_type:complete